MHPTIILDNETWYVLFHNANTGRLLVGRMGVSKWIDEGTAR